MKPIGPLIIEHRLIERMIKLVKKELNNIKNTNQPNTRFIDAAVDFFRIYADRTHHGKEEDILFTELGKQQLSIEHERIMNELVQEHVLARKLVRRLFEANEKYIKGETTASDDIVSAMEKISAFYPRHIDKEDNYFFRPCMKYFRKDEQMKMLQDFWKFDRNMIHEKYKKAVKQYENEK